MKQLSNSGPAEAAQGSGTTANPLLPLWQALSEIADPCQQACGYALSILDLGIVNAITAQDGAVTVSVTFTEPGCLFGYRIVHEIEDRLAQLPGVRDVHVSIDVFPLWEPSRMSEGARAMHSARRLRFGPATNSLAEAVVEMPAITRGVAHV